MQRHEVVARALLKTRGKRVPEFFGLSETDARELIVLAHHCEKQLGLKMSALGPDSDASGVRLELSGGKRGGSCYSVRVSPLGKVSLETGVPSRRQLFRNGTFNPEAALF